MRTSMQLTSSSTRLTGACSLFAGYVVEDGQNHEPKATAGRQANIWRP